MFNTKDSGTVKDPAFNLTQATALISAVVAALVALDGAVTPKELATANTSGNATSILLGFDQGQRVVLLVALIGLVGIVYSVDLIARSYATASKLNAKATEAANTNSSGVVIFSVSRPARLKDATADGKAIAVRASDGMILFDDPKTSTVRWVSGAHVDFRTP